MTAWNACCKAGTRVRLQGGSQHLVPRDIRAHFVCEITEDAVAEDVSITGEAGVGKSDKSHQTSQRL
jgi:hypothetical protein